MRSSQRCHGAAFSLVEMVVALFIFSVAVVAMMEVFTLCLRSTATSVNYSRAVFLAQGLTEESLAEGDPTVGEDDGEFDADLPDGTWTREITETDTAGLYELRVTVQWRDPERERAFELTTLAAER